MTSSLDADVDLAGTVPAAIMVTDLEGKVLAANDELRRWFGATEVVEPRAFLDRLAPSSRIYYESVITPSLCLGGEVPDANLDMELEAGLRHTLWAARCLGDDTACWAGLDITGRVLQQRQAATTERRLARLQRLSSGLLLARSAPAIGDALLAELVDGVKADRGFMALALASGELEVVARHELGGDATSVGPVVGDPVVGAAVEMQTAVFRTVELDGGSGDRSEWEQVAAIPLVGDGILGIIGLRLGRSAEYSREEQQLLIAAADITSASLARTMLHERLETVARRDASLSAVLHAMEAETSVRARAQRLADLLVPDHGELVVVDLDEVSPELAGLRHLDRSKEDDIRRLHRHLIGRGTGRRTPRPGNVADRPVDHRVPTPEGLSAAGVDAQAVDAIMNLGLRSVARVPLVARNRRIGQLTLASASAERDSSGLEEFHRRLADGAALSLDNARLYEHEQSIAQQLQAVLLPEHLPGDARYALAHFYEAATDVGRVGGDWYDAFTLGEDRLALTVGDVVGGGVTAARTMGRLRTAILAFAQDGRGVDATLASLDRFAAGIADAFAASVLYAEVDLVSMTIEYGCAGHLPPVLVAPGAAPVLLDGGRNVLLGLLQGREPSVATSGLPAGSSVVMYTDGLIERPGTTITASIDDLVRLLADERDLARRPHLLAQRFASAQWSDDTCILCFTRSPASPT